MAATHRIVELLRFLLMFLNKVYNVLVFGTLELLSQLRIEVIVHAFLVRVHIMKHVSWDAVQPLLIESEILSQPSEVSPLLYLNVLMWSVTNRLKVDSFDYLFLLLHYLVDLGVYVRIRHRHIVGVSLILNQLNLVLVLLDVTLAISTLHLMNNISCFINNFAWLHFLFAY